MQSLYGVATLPFPEKAIAVSRTGGSAALILSFTAVKLFLEIAMDFHAVCVESLRAASEFCHLLWRALAEFKRLAQSLPNQNSLPLSVLAGAIRPSVIRQEFLNHKTSIAITVRSFEFLPPCLPLLI
jgi:hypothetical protein